MEDKKDSSEPKDKITTPQNLQRTDQRGRLRSLLDKFKKTPKNQETNGSEKEPDDKHGEVVCIDGYGGWGEKFDQVGDRFKLSKLRGAQSMGTSRFNEVYFRTDSGSIWRVNDKREIVRANKDRPKQQLDSLDKLSDRQMDISDLEVGTAFFWGDEKKTFKTGVVREIVAVVETRGGIDTRQLPKNMLVNDFYESTSGESAFKPESDK